MSNPVVARITDPSGRILCDIPAQTAASASRYVQRDGIGIVQDDTQQARGSQLNVWRTPNGVVVGCTHIPTATLEAILKECKKGR